jgi:hypothetical protein
MNWKGYGRKRSWHILMYYFSICLDRMRKTVGTSVMIVDVQAEMNVLRTTILVQVKVKVNLSCYIPWKCLGGE